MSTATIVVGPNLTATVRVGGRFRVKTTEPSAKTIAWQLAGIDAAAKARRDAAERHARVRNGVPA